MYYQSYPSLWAPRLDTKLLPTLQNGRGHWLSTEVVQLSPDLGLWISWGLYVLPQTPPLTKS